MEKALSSEMSTHSGVYCSDFISHGDVRASSASVSRRLRVRRPLDWYATGGIVVVVSPTLSYTYHRNHRGNSYGGRRFG